MNDNIYFQARKRAAEWNEKLRSREGAAELLGVSVSSMSSYELGTLKSIPVEAVVMMADLYKAPELLAAYCKNECPIGKDSNIIMEHGSIEAIAVRLACAIDPQKLAKARERMLHIAADGKVSAEERADLIEVLDYLNNVDLVRQELMLFSKQRPEEGSEK